MAWLGATPRMQIVDCAGGTGDIAFRIVERSRRGADAAHVTIVDVNEEMLRAGRTIGPRRRSLVPISIGSRAMPRRCRCPINSPMPTRLRSAFGM